MIGCNDGEFEDFLLEELDSYNPLLKAIRDPSPPAALQGLCASKALVSDAEPPHPYHSGSHVAFDAKLRGAVLSRLDIPSSIPDSALFSFHQPIGSGGFGSR